MDGLVVVEIRVVMLMVLVEVVNIVKLRIVILHLEMLL